MGTLVPLPTLWHLNGAGILALRNQQPGQAFLLPLVGPASFGLTGLAVMTRDPELYRPAGVRAARSVNEGLRVPRLYRLSWIQVSARFPCAWRPLAARP